MFDKLFLHTFEYQGQCLIEVDRLSCSFSLLFSFLRRSLWMQTCAYIHMHICVEDNFLHCIDVLLYTICMLEPTPFINDIIHYPYAILHILFLKTNRDFASAAPVRSSAGWNFNCLHIAWLAACNWISAQWRKDP